MDRESFTHCFEMPVRWGDADALGHINNVQYVRFLESARVAYCHDVFDMQFQPDLKAGWILADLQCSYLQQLHYPETINVYTRMSRLGNKSATVEAMIFKSDDASPILTSRGVKVWFDYQAQQTTTIPEHVRQQIISFEKQVECTA